MIDRVVFVKALCASLLIVCFASAQVAPPRASAFHGAEDLDALINQAIHDDKIPGAVVLVGHQGKIVYRKAYGSRALVPTREAMTLDTIFDCASLTKVVATTTGIMKLFEKGLVRIDDPVTTYLPEFQGGQSAITVRDLMTHFSGFRPDLDLDPVWSGYDTGIRRAVSDKPANPPETKFVYSDINFELLGEVIHRVSGLPEDEYIRQILVDPLGMKDSGYLPAAALMPRIAPTEQQKDGSILRGVVHDPTARYMGGVAGHAGFFSTADDLAKFCQMLLDGGGTLFSPATIAKFTSPASPANQPIVRGLGWDINSPFSAVRGELFPVGSFGHTGFTGTSIWIDPASKTYVILLANSVHPHLRKAITPLRGKVATIVAAGVGYHPLNGRDRSGDTRTGLDILADLHFQPFQGKRVGVITNHTGVDRLGRRNIDLMRQAGIQVASIFSPEHGIAGVEDRENIGNATDLSTGIKIWSLFGKTLRPTPEMLRGLDAVIFDIQGIGARFYTYETTMIYAMEECAKAHLPFYILDRPNPITGLHVEGPMLDADKLSTVGSFPLPLRHGMTMGELARLVNGERNLHADLRVIEITGWSREDWFDSTELPWVNPSPNIRSLNEALLYPGLAMLEYSTNYSVGRGTDAPFEQIGADWIHGRELAGFLNSREIPGVQCYPVKFSPASSYFAGKTIEGVHFTITNRDIFSSSRLGIELALALRTLYPTKISWDTNRKLIGSGLTISALAAPGTLPPESAWKIVQTGIDVFLTVRMKYLIYR